MGITMIDTWRYSNRLRKAGVPGEQANEMARALGDEIAGQLATRTGIDNLRVELKADIKVTSKNTIHGIFRDGNEK